MSSNNNIDFTINVVGIQKVVDGFVDTENNIKTLKVELRALNKEKASIIKTSGIESEKYKDVAKNIDAKSKAIKENTEKLKADLRNADLSTLSYDRLSVHARELKNELKGMTKELSPDVWENTNKRIKSVTTRMDELDGRAKQVQKSMTFKDSMKYILPTLGVAEMGSRLLGKISEFVGEAWEKSKQVQSEGVKAAQVFGDELGYVEAQAAKSAKMAGLTNREFVAMATNTADLLVPIGFSRKEAAKMSVELQNLTGALTEWSGGKFTAVDVSERITKAMLGETEGLKSLGIAISLESNEYKELYKQKIAIEGTTQEQAKALAIEELIMRKSADAQQAYAEGGSKLMRMGNDLSRMWRSMTESVAYHIATTKEQRFADQARELNALSEEVDNNGERIEVLIPRYEALKNKTNLSAEEQIELKDVIAEIIRIAPNAGAEMTKYGEALGINASVARAATEANKELVKAQNEALSKKIFKNLTEEVVRAKELKRTIDKTEKEQTKKGDSYTEIDKYSLLGTGMNDTPRKRSEDIAKDTEALKKSMNIIYSQASTGLAMGYDFEQIAEEINMTTSELEELYSVVDKEKNKDLYNTDGSKKTEEQIKAEQEKAAADKKAEEQKIADTKKAQEAAEEASKQRIAQSKRDAEQSKRDAEQLIKEEENRQKQLSATTISLSDDLVAKENDRYQKRLQELKLFGKDKTQMTEKELAAMEALEREHNAKLQTIEENKQSASIKNLEESQARKITRLKTSQAEEIAAFTGTAKEREKLTAKHETEMRNLVISNAEELKRAIETILGDGSLSGGVDVSLLSEEQRKKLETEVEKLKLLIAEANSAAVPGAKEKKEEKKGYSFGDPNKEEAVDVLGVNSDDFKTLMGNIKERKEKKDAGEDVESGFGDTVAGATMAITAMSEAYGMYDKFAAAAEARQLKEFEKNTEKKKQLLREQLSSNLITQEQYNARVGELDAEVDAKKAEIELKQAKRNKVQAIFDALINTGVAVVKALPNVPLAIAVGAMGAVQTAIVAATPLPGKEQGGFMVEREDGKTFNASIDPARRGYISNPTVIRSENGSSYITGENGTEYVIPAAGLRNPEIASVVAAIERARIKGEIMNLNLAPIRGYEKGGYTSPSNDSTPQPSITTPNLVAVNDDQTARLISLLDRLERNGIEAKVYMTGKNGIIPMMNKLYERQYNTSIK